MTGNLFYNGDLARADASGRLPDGWILPEPRDVTAEVAWLEEPSSPVRCVRLANWYGGGETCALGSPPVPVVDRRSYLLGFRYKTEGVVAPKQIGVMIRFHTDGGEIPMLKGLPGRTEWTDGVLRVAPPPLTRSISIRIGFVQPVRAALYIAGLWLREVTPADEEAAGLPQMPPVEAPRRVPRDRRSRREATGAYGVEERDGAWWLVDPEGRLTLSIGTVLNYPWPGNPALREWAKRHYPDPADYYRYAFRLAASWGFNALAGWSEETADWSLLEYARDPDLPQMQHYAVVNFALLGGPELHAADRNGRTKHGPHAFPDPFDPEWRSLVAARAEQVAARFGPYRQFAGYFIDNELDIGELYRFVWGRHSGPKFVEYLEEKYHEFGSLAARWGRSPQDLGAESFADLLRVKPEPTSFADPSFPDFAEFARIMFGEYVRFTTEALRKFDPHHLIIGPRQHENASTATLEYADLLAAYDIVALNHYPENVGILGLSPIQQDYIDKIHRLTKRPIIIGETSVPALDSGLYEREKLDWSWPDALPTQRERADAYEATFRWLMSRPYVVGVHWFMWHDLDHPGPGKRRANRGLIGRDHVPWRLLTERMARLHRDVLQV